jgi:hypothetical protein
MRLWQDCLSSPSHLHQHAHVFNAAAATDACWCLGCCGQDRPSLDPMASAHTTAPLLLSCTSFVPPSVKVKGRLPRLLNVLPMPVMLLYVLPRLLCATADKWLYLSVHIHLLAGVQVCTSAFHCVHALSHWRVCTCRCLGLPGLYAWSLLQSWYCAASLR